MAFGVGCFSKLALPTSKRSGRVGGLSLGLRISEVGRILSTSEKASPRLKLTSQWGSGGNILAMEGRDPSKLQVARVQLVHGGCGCRK